MPRRQQNHRIAIHHTTVRIAEQHPVGIAIEGNAQIELSRLFRHCFGYRFRMQRSAAFIDILAVRRAEKSGLDIAQMEQFRRLRCRRAIRAIHQHAQPAQIRTHILRQPLDIGMAQFRLSGKAGSIEGRST